MRLEKLFLALADCLDSDLEIEKTGANALRGAAGSEVGTGSSTPLSESFARIFAEPDAHPVCELIAQMPFNWTPPQTSSDLKYIADSVAKVHVELVGPEGLVKSDEVRLGLYGMAPGHSYGIRTHLAEEVFVMLAGEAEWKKDDEPYKPLRAGRRAYHPSMTPHANRTREHAFMSIYVWRGDVSTDSYKYQG